MNLKAKETINKISAVIIIIAGLINVLAGTIFTISNYSQKNDKFDLDSFLIELYFDNLDFAILFAIAFFIAINAFIKKDLIKPAYMLLTYYSAVLGFITFIFTFLGLIIMKKEQTSLLVLYIIIYITLLIHGFFQLFSNKITLAISKIAICSTVLLVLFNDVEKWQSNPVSRVANYIFFIALAVYTFTIKNKQKLKKGIQV